MMYKAAITLMVLAVATANDDEADVRIKNGDRAPPNAYPWFAKGNGCGAALVTPEFVITAEHCSSYRFERVRIGAVCTGNANRDSNYSNCNSPDEKRYAEAIFDAPDNNDKTHNDLRLVQLTQPSTIDPVKIDSGISTNYIGGMYIQQTLTTIEQTFLPCIRT